MPQNGLNYTKSVLIVHGKSELNLVKFISTNLHLPIKIVAKDKGKHSIQINGLMDLFNSGKFKSFSAFVSEYSIECNVKSKELKNFRLFTIMDTDDCDENTKDKYINGSLFEGHWLKDYVTPIYNIESLEDVMIKAGIMVKHIHESEKGTYYAKIFPINKQPLSYDTIKQINILKEALKGIKETNLEEFINYCLSFIQ